MDDNMLYYGPATDPVEPAPLNLTGEPDESGWIRFGYTDRGWMVGLDEDADGNQTIVMGTPLDLWWAPVGTEIPETWPPPEPWKPLTSPRD